MQLKNKKLVVEQHNDDHYNVVRTENTTEYAINSSLRKKEVDRIIEGGRISVTIIKPKK